MCRICTGRWIRERDARPDFCELGKHSSHPVHPWPIANANRTLEAMCNFPPSSQTLCNRNRRPPSPLMANDRKPIRDTFLWRCEMAHFFDETCRVIESSSFLHRLCATWTTCASLAICHLRRHSNCQRIPAGFLPLAYWFLSFGHDLVATVSWIAAGMPTVTNIHSWHGSHSGDLKWGFDFDPTVS